MDLKISITSKTYGEETETCEILFKTLHLKYQFNHLIEVVSNIISKKSLTLVANEEISKKNKRNRISDVFINTLKSIKVSNLVDFRLLIKSKEII